MPTRLGKTLAAAWVIYGTGKSQWVRTLEEAATTDDCLSVLDSGTCWIKVAIAPPHKLDNAHRWVKSVFHRVDGWDIKPATATASAAASAAAPAAASVAPASASEMYSQAATEEELDNLSEAATGEELGNVSGPRWPQGVSRCLGALKLAAGLEAGWVRAESDAPPPGSPAGPLMTLFQSGGDFKNLFRTTEPGVVAKVFDLCEDRWRREAALVEVAATAAVPPHPNVLSALDVRLGPKFIQLLYPSFYMDMRAVLGRLRDPLFVFSRRARRGAWPRPSPTGRARGTRTV